MFERFLMFLLKKKLASQGIVKFFINRGINPDFKDEEGKSLLHWSVYCNNPEIVRLLLENGAQIDAKDNNGMTPLYWSLNWWNIDKEIAKFLISRGADIHARSNENLSLLHFSDSRHIVKLLISKGLDVNLIDNDGNTPLHQADTKAVAELLISAGADINARNNDGMTPLHSTVDNEAPEVAKLIISAGADINVGDNEGNTPLHLAVSSALVSNYYLPVVELFISAGADVNVKNNEGNTPVEMAEEKSEVLKMFTEKDIIKETALELPSDTKINMETLPGNKCNIHINGPQIKEDLIQSLMYRIGFSTFVFAIWLFFLYFVVIDVVKNFQPVNFLFILFWIYIAVCFLFPWFIRVLTSFFGKVSIEIEKTFILLRIKWLGLYSTEKVIPFNEIDNFEMQYDTRIDAVGRAFPYSVTINCNIKKIELPLYLSEMETKWLYNKLMELL